MRLDRLARPPQLDVTVGADRRALGSKPPPALLVSRAEPDSPGVVFDKFRSSLPSDDRHRPTGEGARHQPEHRAGDEEHPGDAERLSQHSEDTAGRRRETTRLGRGGVRGEHDHELDSQTQPHAPLRRKASRLRRSGAAAAGVACGGGGERREGDEARRREADGEQTGVGERGGARGGGETGGGGGVGRLREVGAAVVGRRVDER